MRIETFDLSVDRSAKPEPSQLARSGGSRLQVLRCDSPATFLVDGSNGQPIPAIPGVVLENFTSLYVANNPAGGRLVLAYYDCSPGAPQAAFPFATSLAYSTDDTAAGADAEVTVPGVEWSLVITGWQAGFFSAAPTIFPLHMALREIEVNGTLSTMLDQRMFLEGAAGAFMGEPLVTRDFAVPLVLQPGRGAKATCNLGAVGVFAKAQIFGYIIKG